MTNQDEYFDYLQRRSRLALFYRTRWLYPRLCKHLRGTVLDVGCGIGDLLRYRPGTIGTDISSRTVEACRNQGLEVHLMVPDQLPFSSGRFEGVVLDNVLEHLAEPAPLLGEIHRVLVPGGTFIVGVPGPRGYESDSDHKIFYDELLLKSCLGAAGFDQAAMFHAPLRSSLLQQRLRIYALYGIYRRRN